MKEPSLENSLLYIYHDVTASTSGSTLKPSTKEMIGRFLAMLNASIAIFTSEAILPTPSLRTRS